MFLAAVIFALGLRFGCTLGRSPRSGKAAASLSSFSLPEAASSRLAVALGAAGAESELVRWASDPRVSEVPRGALGDGKA